MSWSFPKINIVISNETKARIATAVAGAIGAYIATKIPGMDAATATNIATGIFFSALGLSIPHPATGIDSQAKGEAV